MKEEEFYEREFFVNENGLIFDNSLNENLEDSILKVNEKRLKEIYKKQSDEVKEVLEEENLNTYSGVIVRNK